MARSGHVEFKNGKLIGLQIGNRSQGWKGDTSLTVGFTDFPDIYGAIIRRHAELGIVGTRGRNRVYVKGELTEETWLGVVNVAIKRIITDSGG